MTWLRSRRPAPERPTTAPPRAAQAALEALAAQALADTRNNPPPVTEKPTADLWRVRLRDRDGRLHGWMRASTHMATQARAAGLPIRPEADFPLPDIEPAQAVTSAPAAAM